MPKLKNPTGRATEEWIAKSPDEKIPDRVKLRIWNRCDGRCYRSGVVIRPGMPRHYDHIIALCNGGEHRESNLALIWGEEHKAKTAEDRRIKAKNDRVRKKHIGATKPKHKWPKRKMNEPFYRNQRDIND